MYVNPVVSFGCGMARDIELTRERFQTAIVWNLLPKELFFATLVPNSYEDVQVLLDKLDAMGLPAVFNCPDKTTEFVLQKNFYRKKTLQAGCEVWTK